MNNRYITVHDLLMRDLRNHRRLLYGEWLTEEEPTLAEHLASQYHAECDTYDKQVCTGERNGEPMPVTPEEFGAINRHSREVRQRLLRENPGITEMQLHKAIAERN